MIKINTENGSTQFEGPAGEIIKMFATQGKDVRTLSKTEQNRSWGVYNQNGQYVASIVSSLLEGTWKTFAFTTTV